MIIKRTELVLLVAGSLVLTTAFLPGQPAATKAYLLSIGKGQTFSEIGSDGKTKPEMVDAFKELGGKAIKVAFFVSVP